MAENHSIKKVNVEDDITSYPDRIVNIHKHEASCMWIAVCFLALCAYVSINNAVKSWEKIELERIHVTNLVELANTAAKSVNKTPRDTELIK